MITRRQPYQSKTYDFSVLRQRMDFLVTFASTDLPIRENDVWAQLKQDLVSCVTHGGVGWFDGGWNKLKWDLVHCVAGGGVTWCHGDERQIRHLIIQKKPGQWVPHRGKVKALQRDLRHLFQDIADRVYNHVPFPMEVQYEQIRREKHVDLFVRGDLRSLIFYATLHDLAAYPYKPIKRCVRCNRIFYSYRKQKFCTLACGMKQRNDQRPRAARQIHG